jgi:hypothetical protein
MNIECLKKRSAGFLIQHNSPNWQISQSNEQLPILEILDSNFNPDIINIQSETSLLSSDLLN